MTVRRVEAGNVALKKRRLFRLSSAVSASACFLSALPVALCLLAWIGGVRPGAGGQARFWEGVLKLFAPSAEVAVAAGFACITVCAASAGLWMLIRERFQQFRKTGE